MTHEQIVDILFSLRNQIMEHKDQIENNQFIKLGDDFMKTFGKYFFESSNLLIFQMFA